MLLRVIWELILILSDYLHLQPPTINCPYRPPSWDQTLFFFHVLQWSRTTVHQFIQPPVWDVHCCRPGSRSAVVPIPLQTGNRLEFCTRASAISPVRINKNNCSLTLTRCVTFMVISANRSQLCCSAVNHDGLRSFLWRQIFTNVIIMKSDSCIVTRRPPCLKHGLKMVYFLL